METIEELIENVRQKVTTYINHRHPGMFVVERRQPDADNKYVYLHIRLADATKQDGFLAVFKFGISDERDTDDVFEFQLMPFDFAKYFFEHTLHVDMRQGRHRNIGKIPVGPWMRLDDPHDNHFHFVEVKHLRAGIDGVVNQSNDETRYCIELWESIPASDIYNQALIPMIQVCLDTYAINYLRDVNANANANANAMAVDREAVFNILTTLHKRISSLEDSRRMRNT